MAATAKKRSARKPKKTSAASKKSTSPNKNNGATTEKLKKFNIFAGVSSIVFAVLSVVFMSKETIVANLPYATKDAFASTDATIFGPAYKTLCEVEIRYVLAFFFGLSAVFSLLLVTKLRKKYESQLANSSSVIRWIFSGIALALILALSSKVAQVDSTVTLKTTGALVVLTAILWIISERQNKGTKGKLSIYYVSLATLFLAAMPLLVSLVSSGIYGMESFGWHVYALAFTTVFGLGALAFIQYKAIKKGVTAKGYLDLEGKYLSIDYLIKFSAFIILLSVFFE